MAFVLNARLKLLPPSSSDINRYVTSLNSQLRGKINLKVNLDTRGASSQLESVSRNIDRGTKSAKKFNNEQKKSVSRMQDFADKTKLAFKRYSAFVVGTTIFLKLSRVLGDATSEAIEFRKEMIKFAQVTDKSVKSTNYLRKQILSLSSEFGVNSVELAKSNRLLAQAGIRGSRAATALRVLAKTELAPTFDGIATSTEDMIAILRQFELKTPDIAKAFDVINTAASNYAIEASDIGVATRKAGAVFSAAGGQFEDFVALFTAVRDKTRESADTIGTAFKTIIPRLQRSSTQKKLKDLLGINLLNEEGNFDDPLNALVKIGKAVADLPEGSPIASKVFEEVGGLRQIGKTVPLLLRAAKEVEQIQATLKASGGSIDGDVNVALKELPKIVERAEVAFVNLFKTIENSTAFQTFAKTVLNVSTVILQTLDAIANVPGVGDALTSTLLGFTAFKAFGLSKSYGRALLTGSAATKLNSGGYIPGRGPNKDTIPAMLTKGEFVINRKAVDAVGVDFLSALNGYNRGGFVSRNFGSRERERQRQIDKYGRYGEDDYQDDLDAQARQREIERRRREAEAYKAQFTPPPLFEDEKGYRSRKGSESFMAEVYRKQRLKNAQKPLRVPSSPLGGIGDVKDAPDILPRLVPVGLEPPRPAPDTFYDVDGNLKQNYRRSPNPEYRPGGTRVSRGGTSNLSQRYKNYRGVQAAKAVTNEYFGPATGFYETKEIAGPFPLSRRSKFAENLSTQPRRTKDFLKKQSARLDPLVSAGKRFGRTAYNVGSDATNLAVGAAIPTIAGRGATEGLLDRIVNDKSRTGDAVNAFGASLATRAGTAIGVGSAGARIGEATGIPGAAAVGALVGAVVGAATDFDIFRDAVKKVTFGLIDYDTTNDKINDAFLEREKAIRKEAAAAALEEKREKLIVQLNNAHLKHLNLIDQINDAYTNFGAGLLNVTNVVSSIDGPNLGAQRSLTERALSGNLQNAELDKFAELSRNLSGFAGLPDVGEAAIDEAVLIKALPDILRQTAQGNLEEGAPRTIVEAEGLFNEALEKALPSDIESEFGANIKDLLAGQFSSLIANDQEGQLQSLSVSNIPQLTQELSQTLGRSIEAQEFMRDAMEQFGSKMLELTDKRVQAESEYRVKLADIVSGGFSLSSDIRKFNNTNTTLSDVSKFRNAQFGTLGVSSLISGNTGKTISNLSGANLSARERLASLNRQVTEGGFAPNAGIESEYRNLKNTINNTSEALKSLSNVSKELAVIEKQINEEQKKRFATTDFAVDLAFADNKQRRELDIQAGNAQQALRNGIGSIRPDQREGVRNFLERFSDVRLDQFGTNANGQTRTGRDALRALAEKELGLDLGQTKKERDLINKYGQIGKSGLSAQTALADTENDSTRIARAIQEATDSFVTAIRQQLPAFDKLADAMNAMPSHLTGEFTHQVNVSINGVQILKDYKNVFDDIATEKAKDILRQYVKENLPNAPMP